MLTVQEAADLLHISKDAVIHRAIQGVIPSTNVGTKSRRFLRFDKNAILDYRRTLTGSDTRQTFTSEEAAEMVGLSRAGLLYHVKTGRVKPERSGSGHGQYFFDRAMIDDLTAYLKNRGYPSLTPDPVPAPTAKETPRTTNGTAVVSSPVPKVERVPEPPLSGGPDSFRVALRTLSEKCDRLEQKLDLLLKMWS